jgi:serine O-acetyltransferase
MTTSQTTNFSAVKHQTPDTFRDCCSDISSDLAFYAKGKREHPTFSDKLKAFLFNPSFQLLLCYRLGHFFQTRRSKLSLLTLPLWHWQTVHIGSQISFSATLGHQIRFPHPLGIVIGEGAEVKDNATIFQQVTLGSHGQEGKKTAYPVVEANATLYTGAKIIGGVRIGKGAVVGANAVVTIDVPDEATAVGIPARIIKRKDPTTLVTTVSPVDSSQGRAS